MRTHALEMMLATLMVTCGIVLLWPGDTFNLPHYEVMKRIVSESVGGALLATVGTIRWAAIMRNGGSRYSPLWRISGCCVGGGFWFTFAVALERYLSRDMDPTTGPPMLFAVAATAFVFEIYSALRGGADANSYDSLGIRRARTRAKHHVANGSK